MHVRSEADPASGARAGAEVARELRLSIVVEWANARLNGDHRAVRLLERLGRQWEEIQRRDYPPLLSRDARAFLERLHARPQLLLVSSTALGPALEARLRGRLPASFDVVVHLAPGLEYYPLKSFGGSLAVGDLLLFVDCDVLPDEGWLAHLLGSFARPDIAVVCAQTYISPRDLWSRAFAIGWNYDLRDASGGLRTPDKFYANTIAFRAPVFRATGFRAVGRRSRGAATMLKEDLARLGMAVWENRAAGVDHPPPSGLGHLMLRALAEGRDHYMKHGEARSARALRRSLGVAAARLARVFRRVRRHRRAVGLRRVEVPVALAIVCTYYGTAALGGVLTHLSPGFTGRRFRV
jgi:hypothetical protein